MFLNLGRKLILCSLLAACSASEKPQANSIKYYDLNLGLSNFKIHLSHDIVIGVYSRDQKQLLVRQTARVDANGSVSTNFSQILAENADYYLVYFADMNADGICDSPPADHGWVLKIDQVQDNLTVTDEHRMSFTDPCSFFAPPLSGMATNLLVTGSLAIDPDVSGVAGATAGQAIAGAVVFAANFPDQETRTAVDGTFTLQIQVPASQLALSPLNLVTWYTVPQANKKPNEWAGATARLGANTPLNFVDNRAKLEGVSLQWTTALHVKVQDQAGNPKDLCWVRIPQLSFQLVSEALGNGNYNIDYLPTGTYTVAAYCSGLSGQTSVSIGKASGPNSWQNVSVVVF